MTPIEIVFHADDFIIINKPAGVSVHQEDDREGIIPIAQRQCNFSKLWLVHRLDKVTSGLLVLATTQNAAARLSGYFASRQISKYYLAIASTKPNKSQGNIIGDLRKTRNGKWALSKSNQNPSITQFFNCSMGDKKRLFVVKPHTGKTHQIRVVMKSLGSPILGDSGYKGDHADRTYLHAYALRFTDLDRTISVTCMPTSGEWFQTQGFIDSAAIFASPWLLKWPTIPAQLSPVKS